MMAKASRFQRGPDFYSAAMPILKTLTYDEETGRYRDIRPGEAVESVADRVNGPKFHIRFGENLDQDEAPEDLWYNEADAIEDSILFPEEALGNTSDALVKHKLNRISQWEEKGPDMDRFVNDMDTDDEFEDEDEECFLSHKEQLSGDNSERETTIDQELLKFLDDRAGHIDMTGSIKTEETLGALIDEDLEAFPRPEPDPKEDYFPFVEREQSKGK